ncbi:nucleotide-diphospho-sugar transferase [uncultured Maribacter sp.]|uniref:nucleotide-diphospho-sugar transferase n=1 Tax=uncultured Maribacter sp. TaxID=431308 RepID=UPI00262122D6|nr:nucleotide-diphospho-sugar transferase [uncultured Maribacter sp.]
MKYLDIPVLFIVFNRKTTALTSLDAIRNAKPKHIYIAGDGPRSHINGEVDKVEETRSAVLEGIDWDCEIKTLFQESNLGCGPGVYAAINWFFKEVEMGIILEDDCVARPSFFNFSKELLEKYKNDTRIALISGFNQVGSSLNDYSYCFSKYVVCWGWATWRRSWENMNYEMTWKGGAEEYSILSNCGFQGKDYKYWKRRVKAIDDNVVSAWDFQWCYSVGAQNQLGIFPSQNLISNIGFDQDATHTSKSPFVMYESERDVAFPLSHPKFVVPNHSFDKAFYKDRNSLINTLAWYFPKFIKDFVKKVLAKIYSK